MLNSQAFADLSPDVAYWVGYFSAGGNCTTENKVRLVTTLENEDLLVSFQEFLSTDSQSGISYIKIPISNVRWM